MLQFVSARNLEATKQRALLRDDAYARYLNAVTLRTRGVDDGQLTEAKARILVFGTKEVIEKLGLIDKHGSTLYTSVSQKAFVELVIAMRNDSHKLDPEVIHLLLFQQVYGQRLNSSPP